APAGERHADRRTPDRHLDARSAADHGSGVHIAVCRVADGAHENRAERAQGNGAAAQCRCHPRSAPGPRARRVCEYCRALMTEIGAFFAMGGYAEFVWSAYAIAAAVLGG